MIEEFSLSQLLSYKSLTFLKINKEKLTLSDKTETFPLLKEL
jgi:hypothetical protein